MLTPDTFSKIYRISAWYDLIISWPYMTPLTLGAMWSMLNGLHGQVGFPSLPDLTVYGVLFANFFGSVAIVWSIVRLRLNDPNLARYDAATRWLFSAWMITALLNGASPLLWGFLVVEISFGVLQSLPVRRQIA